VPVVIVTAGPLVVRFPIESLVVVSSASTLALAILKEPPAGVAHLSPVASELSATNLIQEQSQRIVLGAWFT
jgi:hypothetical protein